MRVDIFNCEKVTIQLFTRQEFEYCMNIVVLIAFQLLPTVVFVGVYSHSFDWLVVDCDWMGYNGAQPAGHLKKSNR